MPDSAAPLRILQVCSAREAVYGAAISLLTLARRQRADGHRVAFATFRGKRFGAQVGAEGFDRYEFAVRAKVDPLAIARIARAIRAGRFDVVHTHLSTSSVNGCLAARLARVPSVATVHGMSGRLSFAFADRMIAVSEGVKAHLIAQGVAPGRISVVYNGIETDDRPRDADAMRRDLGLSDAGPILGTVARVTHEKGIADGIRVAAALRPEFPGLKYLVVGDGDAMPGCRALAESLGIADAVHFAGYRPDPAAHLAAMDLFLFPSHKEAMGIALVEAMAAGLPVVASRVGGIPEVVTPETGVLRPAHDVAGFVDGVRSLLTDPPRRIELGSNARARARSVFSAGTMAAATEAVYRELAAPAPVLPARRSRTVA